MTAPVRRTGPVGGRPAAWLETGAGAPLVLVHGAGGSAELWAPQLAALGDVAHVLAADLPGHGPAGGRGRPTVDAYAAWLHRFLDVLDGGDAPVLVGHSMGGAIALAVALGRPERLAGLVLLATAARLRVLPVVLALLRQEPAEGAGLLQRFSFAAATPPDRVALVGRVLQETPPLVTLGDYLACDSFDVRAQLGAIRTPTLVLAGSEDQLVPSARSRLLAGGIAGARLVEIPAAGHFPQLEQPAAVNRAIREFVAGLTRAPAGGRAGRSA